MKVAFIVVLYRTPKKEVERLKKEVKKLGVRGYELIFIDNTKSRKGFAYGVNKGIKKGLQVGAGLFVVANPDISLKHLTANKILEGSKYFDIWGLSMKQNGKNYYVGILDRWRMSSILTTKKPIKRFVACDFVTGSLMFIKKEVIKEVGLFDENYGMYYEDVDYCIRAKKVGFKVGIDSKNSYRHFELSKGSEEKERDLRKNRIKILLKYGTLSQKLYEIIRLPKTVFEESKFLFNFISLNFSSILSKLLNFILFIFLIRTFSTAEYGIYTLVWAHIGLLAPLADLGTTTFGIIHLREKNKSMMNNLFSLRLILAFFVLLLTISLAFIFKYDLTIISLIALISVVILANMVSGSVLIQYAIKQKQYLSSIISAIFNILLISILIIAAVIYRNLNLIFILTSVLYGLYFLINLFFLKRNIVVLKFSFNKNLWKQIVRKSFVFVLIGFFAGLYFKLDVFLLNFLKGQRDVGIYSAGYKFFEAFMFIAASYNIVSTPILAKLSATKKLFIAKIKKDSYWLLVLGYITATLGFILAPRILPYILTSGYQESIDVFRIVIFALPMILLTSVFLNTLYVLNKAYLVVILFSIQVVLNFILNLIFIPKYSYLASSYITVFCEGLNTFISFLLVLKLLKFSKPK